MSKKAIDLVKSVLVFDVEPTECPFREFRDNELQPEYWGMGPAAFRASVLHVKTLTKPPADHVWKDDQTQPLPRSVRRFLHGWVRAEDLAMDRWGAEVVVFEDNDAGKMAVQDIQLSHTQVLLRSSFCRKVLSTCYLLEKGESFVVEHQWDNFTFSFAPADGWRAKYHIYSPGTKPGGGQQHRPGLSKNGCYLVRLYYLGAWRCVWVSDRVPVDATDAPLLPFSPLTTCITTQAKPGGKQALLKLAAPDMSSDEDLESTEDEDFPDFNIMHALTGSMNLTYTVNGSEELWKLLISEVPVFNWDDDDDTFTTTVKSRSTKKPTSKEIAVRNERRGRSIVSLSIVDTKHCQPYALPGITPAHAMDVIVLMARDLPLKKPLSEPEVQLWKHYRWIDWARKHGLYEAFDCPRTRFLKISGLLKLSYAPHLLDVQSTDSINHGFREENTKNSPPLKKGSNKDGNKSNTGTGPTMPQNKEELRDWIQYKSIFQHIKCLEVLYYPSMYQTTSAASNPPVRMIKGTSKQLEIAAPKAAPLYLQIDGPDENILRISLSTLHPRILSNSGVPIVNHIEKAYLILEKFQWFIDCEIPVAKAFVTTRGYDSVEVKFEPGRHICRIWVHSMMNWHVMLLSESTLLLGTRDVVQYAAIKECPWASRFLTNLGTAFNQWIRNNRSNTNVLLVDREFYRSYQPDLTWDAKEVGYDKSHLHWMFRQALQSILVKKLPTAEYRNVCSILRRFFCDPDFGLPRKPKPSRSLRDIIIMDPCDCLVPVVEKTEIDEEIIEEQCIAEEQVLVSESKMAQLLVPPLEATVSQTCELATDELPCGILKEERERVVRRHEAATTLQSYWRGTWARKCLNVRVSFTPDVLKALMEVAFGNLEALSSLMNEFFIMYPKTKGAYSIASALTGQYGLRQFTGVTPVTNKCKWIPFFQGVFYCHQPVKVHFNMQSSLPHCTYAVYNNDTGKQMPQVYNAHLTFDFEPNYQGYTVMGHGTLNQASGINTEAHWQLTILSSIHEVFHCCDNDVDGCKEQPIPRSFKLHLEEIFIPNRKNILGGIQISVMKHEAVSFMASATSPDLELEVILRSKTEGVFKEIAKCSGKGEVYWPFLRLDPTPTSPSSPPKRSTIRLQSSKSTDAMSQAYLHTATGDTSVLSGRSQKSAKTKVVTSSGAKNKSTTKLKLAVPEPKIYYIEVIAPNGWPLTLTQWRRVDEVRNSDSFIKLAPEQNKKSIKEKPTGSAKDKDKDKSKFPTSPRGVQLQPEDAYLVLECAVAVGGGADARRDDERDLRLAAAIKSWDAREPGRNSRGAVIRKDFRAEFLEALPPPPTESLHSLIEEMHGEETGEEDKKEHLHHQQGPSPATESEMLEASMEAEEETRYLTMPEQLRDKFMPLYFVPLCTKEKQEGKSVLITSTIAEAANKSRQDQIESALNRMRELQVYNETFVLGRQKTRCQLLEKLFVDSQWNPELTDVLEKRDDAIAAETLNITVSANKKKTDAKKK